ncbi:hypothetical protein ACFPYI_12110 [Halomarina salina]|uniref:Uncharacterized protein n=1 Tax=Halomarina salina TaxID=1872699 RepID=A0ABD5RP34_9EURY|nr:hypothetical protein [Halomarina salina]
MDYGWLINDTPEAATPRGTDTYGPHNMTMFSYAAIDIMHSPAFAATDIGELREVVWDAQRLARIGNWVTTWERELREGDYTAGVVVKAIADDVVSIDELESPDVSDDELIERIHEAAIEQSFQDNWEEEYQSLREKTFTTNSVDLEAYVDGMTEVRDLHRASRGHK